MRKAWQQNFLLGFVTFSVMMTAVVPTKVWAYGYNSTDSLRVSVHQAYYLSPGGTITRVAIADPTIADVNVIDGHSLNIVGIATGSTTLNVWTSYGGRQTYNIIVTGEDPALAKTIQDAINLPGVKVQMIGGKVLLSGTVKNQRERHLAYMIARMYMGNAGSTSGQTGGSSGDSDTINRSFSSDDESIGGNFDNASFSQNKRANVVNAETIDPDSDQKVVNLLDMENPDQINIEAMVIEISKDASKQLGLQYGSATTSNGSGDDDTPTFNAGTYNFGETYGQQRDAQSHWYNRNWLFTHFSQLNMQLNALVNQGKARIISRPNITTMSGQTAAIEVGGEIPYPVKSDNDVSVQYKQYGIILNLKNPTVDDNGNITTKFDAEVSRLDWSNAITVEGYNMPALVNRKVSTTVNIPTGMTMAIGGLMNSQDIKSVNKVPLLGDIPLLGELFKYHNTTHDDSEIMVLITPHVVNEETPVPMTDEMKDTYEGARRVKEAMNKVDTNADLTDDSTEQSTDKTPNVDKIVDKANENAKPGTFHKVDFTQTIRDYEAEKAAKQAAKNIDKSTT